MKLTVSAFKTYKTRSKLLNLVRISSKCWRFSVVREIDGARADGFPVCVGVDYASKAEALADLKRYAFENWSETI